MDIKKKRKAATDYLLKVLDISDKTGSNTERYRLKLSAMSDSEFLSYMEKLRDNDVHEQLYFSAQNMTETMIDIDSILEAAEFVGVELFQHLWIVDQSTGDRIKTPYKYLVVEIPVRRAQQYLDHKISVPDDDQSVDMMSGQVTNNSRAANITGPEILILRQRGLPNTMLEMVKVRGGDKSAYDEFSRSCYETGTGSLDVLSPHTRSKSAVVLHSYLRGMMLDSTILQ